MPELKFWYNLGLDGFAPRLLGGILIFSVVPFHFS